MSPTQKVAAQRYSFKISGGKENQTSLKIGRVPELLINSEKASTSHVFNEYIERFLRFRFSMIQTHYQKLVIVLVYKGWVCDQGMLKAGIEND